MKHKFSKVAALQGSLKEKIKTNNFFMKKLFESESSPTNQLQLIRDMQEIQKTMLEGMDEMVNDHRLHAELNKISIPFKKGSCYGNWGRYSHHDSKSNQYIFELNGKINRISRADNQKVLMALALIGQVPGVIGHSYRYKRY